MKSRSTARIFDVYLTLRQKSPTQRIKTTRIKTAPHTTNWDEMTQKANQKGKGWQYSALIESSTNSGLNARKTQIDPIVDIMNEL